MALGLENCSINHLDASENPFLSKAEVFTAYQALSLQVWLLCVIALSSC